MIGIFDSGVGGLSVFNEIRRLLPAEQLLYFADTKNFPYGNKSEEFLRSRSLEISKFLCSQGARLLVIACNTATAAGVESVREFIDIPVVAVEPPIKPAVALSSTGVIGVIATDATIASKRFRSLVDKYGQEIRIIERSSNDLVPLVENLSWRDGTGQAILKSLGDEFLSQGADAVVLGSTHFSFLKDSLIQLFNDKLIPVGSAEATAQQVLKLIAQIDQSLISPDRFDKNRSKEAAVKAGDLKILVSGDAKKFATNLPSFSNCNAEVFHTER